MRLLYDIMSSKWGVFMKKIISSIGAFMGAVMMYLIVNPHLTHALETIPDSSYRSDISENDLFEIFFSLFNEFIVPSAIAFIFPAVVCLIIILLIDRNKGEGKSILGWIGVYALSIIPIVSIIMLFVWAFGEKTKSDITFRNYARLMLLGYLYWALFIVTCIALPMILA